MRFLTDAAGASTDAYDYDAFGVPLRVAGDTPEQVPLHRRTFRLHRRAGYLRARYLNPATDRFTTVDTARPSLGVPQTLNRYVYASADPMNRCDPSGMQEATLAGINISLAVQSVLISVARVATSRIVQDVVLEALIQSVRVGVAAVVVAGVVISASSTKTDAEKRKWWQDLLDPEWQNFKRLNPGPQARLCWAGFLACLVTGSSGMDNFSDVDYGRLGTIRMNCLATLALCMKNAGP